MDRIGLAFNLIGFLAWCAALAILVYLLLELRIPGLSLRVRAWRRRRLHPELAKEFNAADEEDRYLIAQQMMMKDRVRARLSGGFVGVEYPIVWDYYIPPGRTGFRFAQERSLARQKDLEELRSRFRQQSAPKLPVAD